MHISLGFDHHLMKKYDERGSSVVFRIAFEHQGVYYPDENWIDFGTILIGWWLAAATRLLRDSHEEKFQFMDGPYSITAFYRDRDETVRLVSERHEISWHASLIDITQELIYAAKVVIKELKQIGLATDARISIEKAVEQLDTELRRYTNFLTLE